MKKIDLMEFLELVTAIVTIQKTNDVNEKTMSHVPGFNGIVARKVQLSISLQFKIDKEVNAEIRPKNWRM